MTRQTKNIHRQQVLDVLYDGPMTAAEIREATGLQDRIVQGALQSLHIRGTVDRIDISARRREWVVV